MDNHRKMQLAVEFRQQISKLNMKESSKRRLIAILEKKIKTAFIGALYQFEKEFSEIWGGNKPLGDLTATELKYRLARDKAREAILNNGNNQIRNMINEISCYDIIWNKYHTDLRVKNEGN